MALYDCDGVTIIISTEFFYLFLFYLDIGSVSMPMSFSSNGTSFSFNVEGALMGSRPTGCVSLTNLKKKGSSNRTSFAAYGATGLWGRVH